MNEFEFFVVSGLESSYNVFLRQMIGLFSIWRRLTKNDSICLGSDYVFICKQKQNDENFQIQKLKCFHGKKCFGNQWTRFFIRNWFDVCVKFMMDAWKGKIAALVNQMMLNAPRTELKTNFLFKVEPTNFGFPPLWFKRHPLPCHWIL